MEIAPLMEHRLTFSQSSKDSIRHKGGEYNVLLMGHKSVVTTPSHTGEGWGGVLGQVFGGPWVGDVGGWINSLRTLVVTKFATLQRKRETQEEIKLCALCGLCVRKIIIARREYISHRFHRTHRNLSA